MKFCLLWGLSANNAGKIHIKYEKEEKSDIRKFCSDFCQCLEETRNVFSRALRYFLSFI